MTVRTIIAVQRVVLSIEEYQRQIGKRRITEGLAMPDAGAIAFDPPNAML